MNETPSVVFSGIRPSGDLHIGNYLGAVKQWLGLQDGHEAYFCIVDYHAITTPFTPAELRRTTLETAKDYLAAGVDPKKATLFIQSHVPEHTELAWILGTLVPLGELQRMTQFKEKSEQHRTSVNAGLLFYPILMAADILLYRAQTVPVGEDQQQHVELARVIARKCNHAFDVTFPEPKSMVTQAKRIMSLTDPTRKMSKSDGGKSAIEIGDEPDVIRKKLASAVTDTGNATSADMTAGVKNLFTLLQEFAPDEVARFEKEHAAGTIKYKELKETLAGAIADHFEPFRAARKKLSDKHVCSVLDKGAKAAHNVASATIDEVRKAIGVR